MLMSTMNLISILLFMRADPLITVIQPQNSKLGEMIVILTVPKK